MSIDQHRLSIAVRRQARRMIEDDSALEKEAEEPDFQQVIERVLGREDWTDKLVSGIGRIRGFIHRPQRDTEIPEELRQLLPDMREVEKAYVETTRGYKDFIKMVWEAQHQRRWRE